MKSTFSNIGLTENEIELYFALLELNEATIEECLKVSNLKRSTAYNIAKTLVEKGLIAEIPGQPLRYQMLPPNETLTPIVKNKIAEIQELCEKLPKESALLLNKVQTLYEKTPQNIETDKDFMIIHGQKLVHDLMKKFLSQVEIVRLMHKVPLDVSQAKKAKPVPFGGTTHFLFETSLLENTLFLRMVEAHLRTGRFQYAHVPSLPTQMIIYGEIASVVSANEEKSTTVISQSKEIVGLHISAFESIWEKATPFSIEDIECRKRLE